VSWPALNDRKYPLRVPVILRFYRRDNQNFFVLPVFTSFIVTYSFDVLPFGLIRSSILSFKISLIRNPMFIPKIKEGVHFLEIELLE
jgi:hypothetical protein